MLIIRAAQLNDIEQLLTLSANAGSGMTTMPNDRTTWEKKLNACNVTFSQNIKNAESGVYFLVLEDTIHHKIVGTSAVYSGIGLNRPFYSYKLSTQTHASQLLGITSHVQILHLVNDYTGGTELGSLYLEPDYRKEGNGEFLSRCRQMLLADFPDRFGDPIFAELRGWLNEDGHSPFWDHLGYKFFKIPFAKADFISGVNGYQFISDLMPKFPVYLDLLPTAAQDVVGKVHASGAGALKLLENEGFQYTGYVDIFDAGPCVQTNRKNIFTVKNSFVAAISSIVETLPDTINKKSNVIISNAQLGNYRVVKMSLIQNPDKTVTIDSETAQALHLNVNQNLRYISSGYPA